MKSAVHKGTYHDQYAIELTTAILSYRPKRRNIDDPILLDFRKEFEDTRRIAQLRKLDHIEGNDALVWLVTCGLSVPFQWRSIQRFLTQCKFDLHDAHRLLSITDISSLTKKWKKIHRNLTLSLRFYLDGCQGSWCYHYKDIVVNRLRDKRGKLGRKQKPLSIGHLLNQFGLYNESITTLSGIWTRQTFRIRAVNTFYLEKYKKTASHCDAFKPFLKNNHSPDGIWNSNLLFGLQIYALIKLKQFKKAKKLLKSGIFRNRFKNNSIVTFCAQKLGIKTLHRMDYANDPERSHHFDIFCLFQGMICQYHLKDYLSAICLYHQCNFYAAHPIHFYRLFECYRMIGLYGKALGCLRMAVKRAKGTVPSIVRNVLEHKAELETRLENSYCDVCGVISGHGIFACSGCLCVYYCSRKCQKIGWKVNGHRNECSKRFQGFKKRLIYAKRSPFVH